MITEFLDEIWLFFKDFCQVIIFLRFTKVFFILLKFLCIQVFLIVMIIEFFDNTFQFKQWQRLSLFYLSRLKRMNRTSSMAAEEVVCWVESWN